MIRDTRHRAVHPGTRAGSQDSRNGNGDGPEPTFVVSVVVPTKDEAGNIEPLLERLEAISLELEVVFVDDSDDDTPAVVERASQRSGIAVRLIHREPEDRRGGLGSAVVEGLRAARADWVCVMDADLQHPPDRVQDLVARAQEGDVDLVVASRYTDGGTSNLGAARGAVSRLSNLSARLLFPRRLRGVTDPMTGFFLFRKDAVDPNELRPQGFKILLEILARTPRLRVAEIPFDFGERFAGESKASIREGLTYAGQLARLRVSGRSGAFIRFGLVGGTGLAVNLAVFAALYAVGAHYLVAALLATQASTLWLFVLTDRWVFAGRANRRRAGTRVGTYFAMNNLAFLVRSPFLILLVSGLGIDPLLGNLFTLLALTVVRFVVADSWIWKEVGVGQCRAEMNLYSIHGLVAVESDVALPELERFRVQALGMRPTVRVRTGALGREQSELVKELGFSARHIRYDEGLGRFGFAVDISVRGESTTIVAAPLLRTSPHVLYTNIVEPVLRWTFVRKGYALVHAACVSFGNDAVLVTARTDTGKTTTILKTLDTYDCGFVSDDLTLISPEGHVLTYPKPLTVSRHTVAAVSTPTLSRRERLGLPLQSRIHSRSGRRFAMILARTHLPVATINTLVQLLVPPPKYHVDRLVPGVECTTSADLKRLVVIERAPHATVELDESTALATLLENCEDAYGFPPYPTIASFLHGDGAADLHRVERAIVASALTGVPAMLLRSETMDWFQRLPSVLGTLALEPHESRPEEVAGHAISLQAASE